MLNISGSAGSGMTRRTLLRAGTLGLSGLTLADFLRVRASGAATGRGGDDLSIILVWLDGGPPQHETYDPKPDAAPEVRGPIGSIASAVPGVRISELLPRHAAILDKVALLRAVHHDNDDHFTAAHWMLTGYSGPNGADTTPVNPSFGSIITRIKGTKRPGIPPYVGLPHTHSVGLPIGYHGAAYLGRSFDPFNADGDPNNDAYRAANLELPPGVDAGRLASRKALLDRFDAVREAADRVASGGELDQFQSAALEMVSGPRARAAFDLSQEPESLRDRYGRHQWGQSALLSRRLVEAGVRFVTLTFGGWDWHASIESGMHRVLPILDAAVATLIQDLDQRGLLGSTMVIVMGEFGRTPRLNNGLPNDPIPGRDHNGRVMSVLMAGGGILGGQVVGASDARGGSPAERGVRPPDIIATIYDRLGIDPETAFLDRTGRPITIGSTGVVIPELTGRSGMA